MEIEELRERFAVPKGELQTDGRCDHSVVAFFEDTGKTIEIQCNKELDHDNVCEFALNDGSKITWEGDVVNFVFVPKPITCRSCHKLTRDYNPESMTCIDCVDLCYARSDDYPYLRCGRQKGHDSFHYDFKEGQSWMSPEEVLKK